MQTAKQSSSRILSLDILRGITIAGMIMVNNQGDEEHAFLPLTHAEWIGLTPTDLVFPFFMFIMGITTYLSLKKYQFEWSMPCVKKIVKRAFLLWFIGLAIAWLLAFCRGMVTPEDPTCSLGERLWAAANTFGTIRILGVLPRLGICYGLAALTAITVKHKYIPWLIAAIFVAYYVILECFNGYAHDASNVIAVIDNAILGSNHVYRWDSPDPEGILSTFPAWAHVLIGFSVGRFVMQKKDLNDKIEMFFIVGALLVLGGFLLSYACPISKKLWTPTFSMVSCGLASTLLALLTWVIDKRQHQNPITHFFHIFGVNPLALYIFSDLLLIPLAICFHVQQTCYQDIFVLLIGEPMGSLLWSLIFVALVWLFGCYLFKKKIFIKL